MKRLLVLALTAVMILPVASVMIIPGAAAVEGDWVATRAADDYQDPDSYRPYCGFHYEVDKGLVLDSADYTNNTPYTHIHTKTPYNLKDTNAAGNGRSISLEFTVTDFAYEGSDHWVGISLHSKEIFAPGQKGYGEGVSVLIRGAGEGAAVAQFFYLNDDRGYTLFSQQQVTIPVNEQGQETYTFEVEYTGTGYSFYLCGTKVEDVTKLADETLDTYCADGAYVGISFYTTASGSSIGANISKFQGEVPFGEDSMEPEENRNNFAPIADSSTVPEGQPALIWNSAKEQFNQFQSSNIDLAVNEDGTMKATALTASGYIIFSPKVAVSYEAADFPVIAILTRACYAESGLVFYSAGKNLSAQPDCSCEIDIAEYDFGDEWCMGILDLTDDLDWQGRVNMIRMDIQNVNNTDEELKHYDIAYIACFRTIEDAEKYAEAYLTELLGALPETTEKETNPPKTDAPETEEPSADQSETESEEQTTEAEKSGCGAVVAAPIVALIALLGVAFVAKKRD